MRALADGFDNELDELRAEVDAVKNDYRRYKAVVHSERDPDMVLN
jgi:hypothetical protein